MKPIKEEILFKSINKSWTLTKSIITYNVYEYTQNNLTFIAADITHPCRDIVRDKVRYETH